jgi:hypothetical protein
LAYSFCDGIDSYFFSALFPPADDPTSCRQFDYSDFVPFANFDPHRPGRLGILGCLGHYDSAFSPDNLATFRSQLDDFGTIHFLDFDSYFAFLSWLPAAAGIPLDFYFHFAFLFWGPTPAHIPLNLTNTLFNLPNLSLVPL